MRASITTARPECRARTTRWLALALVGLLGSACASSTAYGPVHRFTDNWGSGPGCAPFGETRTLRGRLVVRPFGKGSDGVMLRVHPQERWILSYRATGVLRRLDGKRVEVTGRACRKEGEALYGDHFDLETLRTSR